MKPKLKKELNRFDLHEYPCKAILKGYTSGKRCGKLAIIDGYCFRHLPKKETE